MFPVTKPQQCVSAASLTSNIDTETASTARNLDSVTTIKVCRVCLITSEKMYRMLESQLSVKFERLTGFEINTEDMLPQMICWECAAKLSSAHTFLEKASKTHWLLVKKLKYSKNITMSDIESIDRAQHQLESTFGFKYYKENYSDVCIVEESDKIYEHEYNSENYNYCEDRKVEHCELNDIDQNNVEEPIIITEVNITDEKDPIKKEYLDINEEQNLAYEDKKHELKFQNLHISIKEEQVIDNVSSEMSIEESQILGDAREFCGDIKHSQKPRQKNWKSEALPHCKEPRVVVEDILLTSNKRSIQDALKQLADTAASLKVKRILCHPLIKNNIILAKKNNFVEKKERREDAIKSSKKVSCDICGKQFQFKSTLIRHIRKHPKMYSCTYCSYKSNDKRNLSVHVNARHTKTNAYDCSFCSYKAYNKSNLSTHVNAKHTKANVYNCSHCNYKSYKKSSLSIHINVKHTKTNAYNCSHCSYKAYDKRTLTRHINCIHTKTKAYSCSLCSYKAYDKSILTRHVNSIHTKTKVYNCSYCSYKTYDKKTLTRHINAIHTKTKTYNCSLCSYKAYDKSTLTKHVNAKHNKTFKLRNCKKQAQKKTI